MLIQRLLQILVICCNIVSVEVIEEEQLNLWLFFSFVLLKMKYMKELVTDVPFHSGDSEN